MKRSAIPGLLLALLGIVLFAHQDIARFMQKRTELHATRVRRNEAALRAEQAFPSRVIACRFFLHERSGAGGGERASGGYATTGRQPS